MKQFQFNSIYSPFKKNIQIFDIIKQRHPINYIVKIGILCKTPFNLDLAGDYYQKIIISLNNQDFILGRNGILELEDVEITSIKFKTDINIPLEITYYYK